MYVLLAADAAHHTDIANTATFWAAFAAYPEIFLNALVWKTNIDNCISHEDFFVKTVSNTVLITVIATSSVAMTAIAANSAAMTVIAANSAAMTAIAANKVALDAIAAKKVATDIISASSTAISVLVA